MNTSNPALNERALRRAQKLTGEGVMTVMGAVRKTALLTFVLIAAATYTWWRAANDGGQALGNVIAIGAIGGLIVGFATVFKPAWSPYTAPLYAVLEGLAIGGISMIYSSASFSFRGVQGYPGIALQAAALTFGVLAVMLVLYRAGVIHATEKFRSVIMTAMLGIVAYYVLSFIVGFFGITMPLIHSNGLGGIAFSLFVCGIAGFSLILDFDAVERAANAQAPAYYEWYTAFGLLVGLVWLYLELLRLLAKFAGRRN